MITSEIRGVSVTKHDTGWNAQFTVFHAPKNTITPPITITINGMIKETDELTVRNMQLSCIKRAIYALQEIEGLFFLEKPM